MNEYQRKVLADLSIKISRAFLANEIDLANSRKSYRVFFCRVNAIDKTECPYSNVCECYYKIDKQLISSSNSRLL